MLPVNYLAKLDDSLLYNNKTVNVHWSIPYLTSVALILVNINPLIPNF